MNITTTDISLTVDDFLEASVNVFGITGSGKSYTLGVLMEEFVHAGKAFSVIDPLGQFWTLKQLKDANVWVAGPPHPDGKGRVPIDLPLTTPAAAAALAEQALTSGMRVVLDVSNWMTEKPEEELKALVLVRAYLGRLWRTSDTARQNHPIFVDEASYFIPQSGEVATSNIVRTIQTKGRQRGLTFIMAAQRPAQIEKNIVTQASMFFLHRQTWKSDIDLYRDALADLPANEVRTRVKKLGKGECYFLKDGEFQVIQVRKRQVTHGGAAPGSGDTAQPLQSMNAKALAKLRKLLEKNAGREVEAVDREKADLRRQVETLQAQVEALTATVAEKDAEIERLKTQVETLGKLSVEVNGSAPASLQRMDVNTIAAKTVSLPGAVTTPAAVVTPPAKSDPQPAPKQKPSLSQSEIVQRTAAIERARKREQRHVDDLVRRVRLLNVSQRYALVTILDNPNHWFSRRNLEIRQGLADGSLKMKLVDKLGITEYRTENYARQYRSILPKYLADYCSHLDHSEIHERLVRVTSEK